MYLSTVKVEYEFKFFCPEIYSIQNLTEEFREIYEAIATETENVPNLFDIRMYSSNLVQRAFIERIALGKEELLDDQYMGEGIVAHIQDIMESHGKDNFDHGVFACIQEFPTLFPNEDIADAFLSDALYIFNLNQWRYHDIECYAAYNFMLLSDQLRDILDARGKKEFDINNPTLGVW